MGHLRVKPDVLKPKADGGGGGGVGEGGMGEGGRGGGGGKFVVI